MVEYGATSGFLSGAGDPCDADNFPASSASYTPTQRTIAANCAKVGIDVATFQQNSSIRVFNRGGAETGLSAETSKNWSAGVVLRPSIPESVGALSVALDYFDIKIANGVQTLGAGTILGRCYSEVTFDPAGGFCKFAKRDANKLLDVTSGYVNLSTNDVKGWELAARFATDAVGTGRLIVNANVTKIRRAVEPIVPRGVFARLQWNHDTARVGGPSRCHLCVWACGAPLRCRVGWKKQWYV